jgi:NarL family two-component system sensor histidine kinase LiaS
LKTSLSFPFSLQKLKSVFTASYLYFRHNNLVDSFSLANCERSAMRLVRFILLVFTSAFYLVGPPDNSFHIKLVVVLAMVVASVLAHNLYETWHLKSQQIANNARTVEQEDKVRSNLLKIVFAEIVGISLLIIPTGGLDSPFAWYALNPIIMAAYFAPGFYSWAVLGLFLSLACGVSQLYPGHGTYFAFLVDHLSQLLVFFLTTSIVQVAAALHKMLVLAYDHAEAAHQSSERALQHISSLYHALEAFNSREDQQQLAEVLAEFTGRLASEPAACLLQRSNSEQLFPENMVLCSTPALPGVQIDWNTKMQELWARVESGNDFLVQVLDVNSRITARTIVSQGQCFGLLAFWDNNLVNQEYQDRKKTLQFLADLGGITLDRFHSDQLWGRLLVSEEQNRISNELHDSIAQYLFSINCALHALSCEEANLQDERIQEQLKLVRNTAQRAATELRSSIYKLNPSQRGESVFIDTLASYLDDLGRLNSIKVDLQAEGSEEILSPDLRKGLYRIVREACSNAVRHGKCTSLQVSLSISPKKTVLSIKDDGCSFNSSSANWKPGLGIRNMKQIAAGFDGEVEIQHNPGGGTLVLCTIPGPRTPSINYKEAIGV